MRKALSRRFRIPALLMGMILAVANTAGAQAVKFEAPEVGDRRVVLRWNRASGDTLDKEDRERCQELCGECCRTPLFGGYQIWRSLTPDPSKMILLRTYSLLDTTWTFQGTERVFVDPDSIVVRACGGIPGLGNDDCIPVEDEAIAPFNGFPYYYAVTFFNSSVDTVSGSPRFLESEVQSRSEGILTEPVLPAAVPSTVSPILGRIQVVPNPFNPADEFQRATFGSENRLQFIHLPSPATVRVYTVSGDHVVTLENRGATGTLDWNLKNGNGDDVKGGIYMFVVEADQGRQSRSGHFVIIR